MLELGGFTCCTSSKGVGFRSITTRTSRSVARLRVSESSSFTASDGSRLAPRSSKVQCTIVFADSPYTTYVPIRFGVIESVVVEDSHTTLGVKLTVLVLALGGLAIFT